jgi:short subunit dehydrogenase-like uncharacterized protein
MTQESRQYELVLLGATGYTGKLTAEYISLHLPTNLRWAIAGRNTEKLQKVVDDLKRTSPDRKQPGQKPYRHVCAVLIRVPDVEVCELEQDQLTTLARKTRLIITTVGPYMFHGEPVLAACAENGTHYLDW